MNLNFIKKMVNFGSLVTWSSVVVEGEPTTWASAGDQLVNVMSSLSFVFLFAKKKKKKGRRSHVREPKNIPRYQYRYMLQLQLTTSLGTAINVNNYFLYLEQFELPDHNFSGAKEGQESGHYRYVMPNVWIQFTCNKWHYFRLKEKYYFSFKELKQEKKKIIDFKRVSCILNGFLRIFFSILAIFSSLQNAVCKPEQRPSVF